MSKLARAQGDAPAPDGKRAEHENFHAVPAAAVKYPRDLQALQPGSCQQLERRALCAHQVRRQGVDADLGVADRVAVRAEKLEHRLAVRASRAEVHADHDRSAEHGAEVRLDGLRSWRYADEQP